MSVQTECRLGHRSMNWILRIFLLVCLFAASDVPSAGAQTSIDPCGVLTPDAIAAAVGHPVGPGQLGAVNATYSTGPLQQLSTCRWPVEGDSRPEFLEVGLRVWTTAYDAQAMLDFDRIGMEDADELGLPAAWDTATGSLFVARGPIEFYVEAPSREQAAALATQVLSALP